MCALIQNESALYRCVVEHKPDGNNRGTPSRARELLWIGCGVVSAVWKAEALLLLRASGEGGPKD